jgi:hypothetical protein
MSSNTVNYITIGQQFFLMFENIKVSDYFFTYAEAETEVRSRIDTGVAKEYTICGTLRTYSKGEIKVTVHVER